MDNELRQLTTDVGSLAGRVDTLETKLGAMERRIGALDTKVDENHSTIVSALKRIESNLVAGKTIRPSIFRRAISAIAALVGRDR